MHDFHFSVWQQVNSSCHFTCYVSGRSETSYCRNLSDRTVGLLQDYLHCHSHCFLLPLPLTRSLLFCLLLKLFGFYVDMIVVHIVVIIIIITSCYRRLVAKCCIALMLANNIDKYFFIIHLLYKMCTTNKVKYIHTKTKIAKNCSINYDKCTLHANMVQMARLILLTKQYRSFIKYLWVVTQS